MTPRQINVVGLSLILGLFMLCNGVICFREQSPPAMVLGVMDSVLALAFFMVAVSAAREEPKY